MRRHISIAFLLTLAALCSNTRLSGQNLEAGLHLGVTRLDSEILGGTETEPERGVWLQIWPSNQLAFSADWSFSPRDDFQLSLGDLTVGERQRNRQHVDLTLQYHFINKNTYSFFAEMGGGWLWNNRDVINPGGVPGFEEPGKESTRRGVWTVGGGFRRKIVPHLNWIGEVKFHNPGREDRAGTRFITGITVSWK